MPQDEVNDQSEEQLLGNFLQEAEGTDYEAGADEGGLGDDGLSGYADDVDADEDNEGETPETLPADDDMPQDVTAETAPEPAPVAKPARFVPAIASANYTEAEEAELGEMLTSLDPAKVFRATHYMQRKESAAMEARMLANQVFAADDPFEPMVQQELYKMSQQNPNVYSDPQSVAAAKVGAAYQIGFQRGDIMGTMQGYLFPETVTAPAPARQPNRTPPVAPPNRRMPSPSVTNQPPPVARGTGGGIMNEIATLVGGLDEAEQRALARSFRSGNRR